MTIKDLVSEKDYDYISIRMTVPEGYGVDDIFIGCAVSKSGRLIPLDGDVYPENTEVVRHQEWSAPEKGIVHGLTVVLQ